GLRDRLERLARRGPVAAEGQALRPRLDDHHAHAVGEDVVQLARDPRPLLGCGDTGVGLPLTLECSRPFSDHARVKLALANETARKPSAAEDDQGKEEVVEADPDDAGSE